MRRAVPCCCALLLTLYPAFATLRAQVPETFENLQILDEGISQRDLVGVMRSWSRALGVRCNHCHVGPDNLKGMDFATDEKPTKRTARRMFVMSRQINAEGLAGLPVAESEGRERPRPVTCFTCHRGQPEPPRPTFDLIEEEMAAGGPAAAIERFEALRSEHSEAGRYDLRPGPVFHLGRSLLNDGRLEEARALIVALLDLFPDFADGHVLLGQTHAVAGELDAAEAAIAAARRIEPENSFARWLEGEIQARRTAAAEGDASGSGDAGGAAEAPEADDEDDRDTG